MTEGTPLQKCIMSLQQKYSLMGKGISTKEATRQCMKKFPVKVNAKKSGKRG